VPLQVPAETKAILAPVKAAIEEMKEHWNEYAKGELPYAIKIGSELIEAKKKVKAIGGTKPTIISTSILVLGAPALRGEGNCAYSHQNF
jgi:hypothetical protein